MRGGPEPNDQKCRDFRFRPFLGTSPRFRVHSGLPGVRKIGLRWNGVVKFSQSGGCLINRPLNFRAGLPGVRMDGRIRGRYIGSDLSLAKAGGSRVSGAVVVVVRHRHRPGLVKEQRAYDIPHEMVAAPDCARYWSANPPAPRG